MENEKCPFCGCSAIYEIERNDDLIVTYPQLFCNGCKMVFETENNSPYLKDKDTFNYLREKTWRTWNTRTLPENTIQLPCKVGDEVRKPNLHGEQQMDDLTIGQRASRLIDGRSWDTNLPVTTLMEMLGTNRQVYYNWRSGREDPSAKLLAKMALAGYDVLWVLTGMERGDK